MKILAASAGKFLKSQLLAVAVFALALSAGSMACADVVQDVGRLFELHAKLMPGMAIDELNEMLGPPAEKHPLAKGSNVTRYAWLHGEMGIEAYEVEESVYRVAITLPCGGGKGQLYALDALTRQGRAKYGSMPRSDPVKNEYYWVKDNVRFAFARYNKTMVLSSSTKVR